jgi:glutathione S-transferase
MFWDFDRFAPPTFRLRGQALGFRNLAPETVEMYRNEVKLAYGMLETHLTGRDFMVGAGPTIADIDIYGVLAYAAAGGIDLTAYPAISAFMQRFVALPGFGLPEEILPKADRD